MSESGCTSGSISMRLTCGSAPRTSISGRAVRSRRRSSVGWRQLGPDGVGALTPDRVPAGGPPVEAGAGCSRRDGTERACRPPPAPRDPFIRPAARRAKPAGHRRAAGRGARRSVHRRGGRTSWGLLARRGSAQRGPARWSTSTCVMIHRGSSSRAMMRGSLRASFLYCWHGAHRSAVAKAITIPSGQPAGSLHRAAGHRRGRLAARWSPWR